MSDTPKTVTVKATRFHTHQGEAYEAGECYEVDEAEVSNLLGQGLVTREDAAPPEVVKKKSKPVSPLTTDDFHGKK